MSIINHRMILNFKRFLPIISFIVHCKVYELQQLQTGPYFGLFPVPAVQGSELQFRIEIAPMDFM